jgi:thioredoxin 1
MISILYFTTSWCSPCRMFGPVVNQVGNELNITIEKIDADTQKDLVQKYNVTGVPTLIFLRFGNEAGRHMGVMPKPVLIKKINSIR